jgi:ArsR family transcriptional regulator, arsenate/arsenite/antimonite-responsive transcriptional repressor
MAVGRKQLKVSDAVQVYAALGHPLRLRAVMFLASRPGRGAYAGDLVAHLRRAQSTVSHHLKVLVEAGLVSIETRGSWGWYALVPARFYEFGEHLSRLSATAPVISAGVVAQT